MVTQHVMSMEMNMMRDDDLHYDISDNSPISMSHILAICLYTDNTKLCTAFSSTFRNNKSYDLSHQ